MKIYCEKCHKDISLDVDVKIEKFEVGKIQCKECKKIQSRYISEADLLLYMGLSELLYLFLSIITAFVFYFFGIDWLIIPIVIVFIIGGYFAQKTFSRYIYNNAPLKKDYCNKEFKENPVQITRSLNWQFILFFALAITAITGTTYQLFFLFVSFIAILITFLKYYLCIKKEKKEQ